MAYERFEIFILLTSATKRDFTAFIMRKILAFYHSYKRINVLHIRFYNNIIFEACLLK